jgi:hypothetical protein
MRGREVGREEIDALLEFLPRFERPGRTFASWGAVERNRDGSISLPSPVYDEDVEEFFRRVGAGGWLDSNYQPAEAARMLADEEQVGRASLEQIKAMLTYCVRGERFGDGHWESLLKNGRIAALLRRLEALREQM